MPTENHGGHSVQGAVELYLDRGVPRQKIVLGLALYGKTFLLSDTRLQQPGRALFTQGGDPSSCIETRGDMAYNEISSLLHPTSPQQPAVIPRWDPDGRAFYFVYGHGDNNWVGYDDRPSLDLKLQLVTEADLAGVMWWSLDQDLDRTSEEKALFKTENLKKEKKKGKKKEKKIEKKKGKKKGKKEDNNNKLRPRAIPQVPFLPHQAEESAVEVAFPTSSAPARKGSSQVPSPDEPTPASPPFEMQRELEEGSVPSSCPPIQSPPAALSSISQDILGRPGLVPYVSSKRTRCKVVVNYPHVLPETPVGNVVMTRCLGPDHCPESWRAYTCSPSGWGAASPCFGKRIGHKYLLSPAGCYTERISLLVLSHPCMLCLFPFFLICSQGPIIPIVVLLRGTGLDPCISSRSRNQRCGRLGYWSFPNLLQDERPDWIQAPTIH